MRVRVDEFEAPVEIFRVVGPEMQARSRVRTGGKSIEHGRLDEAVFVVAFFRPRVRKEENDFRKAATFGQGEEKFRGFSLEKGEVFQRGKFAFAIGSFDAFGNEIESDAKFLRERLGVGGEKVPVPAADFER